MRRGCFALLLLLAAAVAQPAVETTLVVERTVVLAPGVVHERGTMHTTTADRQAVHLVTVARERPFITIEASLSNERVEGLESTTAQANRRNRERHRAVAAVNGDFWGRLDSPLGLHIQDGELISDGPGARPAVGILAGGRVLIAEATVTGTLSRPDGAEFEISRVNQARGAGQLVLFTPRFGNRTRTDFNGVELIVGGVTPAIRPTGMYRGVVRRAGTGNSEIAGDELVLSGSGKAAEFLAPVQAGDAMSLTFAITAGWEDVVHAVGGGHWLVRDGIAAATIQPGFSDVTHPRTAIGLTAKGELIFATVDGRQPGYSIGVTLPELAELMLSRGAVAAINLDGGGSTTMTVRLPGTDGVTQVNRGSDGFEREVSNSIVVFSSAPTGPLAILRVFPEEVVVLRGSGINYRVRGQDAAYNAVTVDRASIAWSASPELGTIDRHGTFLASGTGPGEVSASLDPVRGDTAVSVVSRLAALEIDPDPAIVNPRATQEFVLSGRDDHGREVLVDASQARWKIDGPVGRMRQPGLLSASARGIGSVSARIGEVSVSTRVDIGKPPVVLEDFERLDDLSVSATRATATLASAMRPHPVRHGTRAARLAYDFRSQEAGTSAATLSFGNGRPIESRPRRVGIWVYGNSSRHWLRGTYLDGSGARKVVDFTARPAGTGCASRTGGIDWSEWKYVEAPIPAEAILPLKWERIYLAELDDACDDAGELFLDDLRAVYLQVDRQR